MTPEQYKQWLKTKHTPTSHEQLEDMGLKKKSKKHAKDRFGRTSAEEAAAKKEFEKVASSARSPYDYSKPLMPQWAEEDVPVPTDEEIAGMLPYALRERANEIEAQAKRHDDLAFIDLNDLDNTWVKLSRWYCDLPFVGKSPERQLAVSSILDIFRNPVNDGKALYVPVREIAKDNSIGKTTVYDMRAELEKAGYITFDEKASSGKPYKFYRKGEALIEKEKSFEEDGKETFIKLRKTTRAAVVKAGGKAREIIILSSFAYLSKVETNDSHAHPVSSPDNLYCIYAGAKKYSRHVGCCETTFRKSLKMLTDTKLVRGLLTNSGNGGCKRDENGTIVHGYAKQVNVNYTEIHRLVMAA
jgi:hypothetical protein